MTEQLCMVDRLDMLSMMVSSQLMTIDRGYVRCVCSKEVNDERSASDVISIMRPRSNSSDEIIIVPLREIPRDYAKREIADYIQRAGGRKVYISELAEELCLDIELIMEVMQEQAKRLK